jgi:hypothetical protein
MRPMRPADQRRSIPYLPRPMPRPRPGGGAEVEWHTHQPDLHLGTPGIALRHMRQPHEGRDLGEARALIGRDRLEGVVHRLGYSG